MAEATVTFRSAADPARLQRTVSDPGTVASLMPEVTKVEPTGPTTARWTVRLQIGPLRRESVYEGELLESTATGVRFRATGPEAVVEGRVEFAAADSGGTDVRVVLTTSGRGPLKPVVDAALARRVKDDVRRFATALEAKLATP